MGIQLLTPGDVEAWFRAAIVDVVGEPGVLTQEEFDSWFRSTTSPQWVPVPPNVRLLVVGENLSLVAVDVQITLDETLVVDIQNIRLHIEAVADALRAQIPAEGSVEYFFRPFNVVRAKPMVNVYCAARGIIRT